MRGTSRLSGEMGVQGRGKARFIADEDEEADDDVYVEDEVVETEEKLPRCGEVLLVRRE